MKRLIFTLPFLLFVFMFFPLTAKADTIKPDNDSILQWVKKTGYNNLEEDYSKYKYVIVADRYNDGNHNLTVFYSDYQFKVIPYSDSVEFIHTNSNVTFYADYYFDSKYLRDKPTGYSVRLYYDALKPKYSDGKMLFKYANYDVLDYRNSDVFFSPPIVPILVRATKKVGMGMAIIQVIGLIPLLIPLVVGFLALRKAYQKLSETLRRV